MARFVEVTVVAHPELPEGFFGRWRLAEGRAEDLRAQVDYSPDEGEDGCYAVEALWRDGRRGPARQVWVEDSAAGVSALLIGGDLGLRLRLPGQPEHAEAYLLLAE